MAIVDARDVPVSREMVYSWLQLWKGSDRSLSIRDFLDAKLKENGFEDIEVNTSEHESLRDTTPLLEMIMEDLPSYGDEIN